MSKWTKTLACSAALVYTLINLSLIQVDAGPDIDYMFRDKNMDEVENILKGLKKEYEEGTRKYSHVKDINIEMFVVIDEHPCWPTIIHDIVEFLNDSSDSGLKGLREYVEHHFKTLIPVCVSRFRDSFYRLWSSLEEDKKDALKKINEGVSKRDVKKEFNIDLDDLNSYLDQACDVIRGSASYMDDLNYYKDFQTILKDKNVEMPSELSQYNIICQEHESRHNNLYT